MSGNHIVIGPGVTPERAEAAKLAFELLEIRVLLAADLMGREAVHDALLSLYVTTALNWGVSAEKLAEVLHRSAEQIPEASRRRTGVLHGAQGSS